MNSYEEKFKIGEAIKVNVSRAAAPDRWVCATFLDEVPGGRAMIELRGEKKIWDIHSTNGSLMIKRYVKLKRLPDGTIPELEDFASKHWEHLKKVVSLGVTKILGNKAPELQFDEEEKSISIDNGWITIAPGVSETTSILGFLEKPSWFVSVAVRTSGSYWEPPDVDVVEIGDTAHPVGAAELFVTTIWKETNKGFWDSIEEYEF